MRFSKLCVSLLSTLMLPPVQTGAVKSALSPPALTVPSHIVFVMEENHSYSEIIGSPQARYITTLASEGALFIASHGVTHPSNSNNLRALEAIYGPGYLGKASGVKTITDVWQ